MENLVLAARPRGRICCCWFVVLASRRIPIHTHAIGNPHRQEAATSASNATSREVNIVVCLSNISREEVEEQLVSLFTTQQP